MRGERVREAASCRAGLSKYYPIAASLVQRNTNAMAVLTCVRLKCAHAHADQISTDDYVWNSKIATRTVRFKYLPQPRIDGRK